MGWVSRSCAVWGSPLYPLNPQVCPVLEVRRRDVGGILEDYVFSGDRKGWRCAVLGYGMMYNSQQRSNLWYYRCAP